MTSFVFAGRHNVKFHRSGVKNLIHPIVGPLTLSYEAFELAGDDQRLNVYTAEAHSASQEALDLLQAGRQPLACRRPAGRMRDVRSVRPRHKRD